MKLTRKRRRWFESRKEPLLVGLPLKPNAAVEQRYRAGMDKLVDAMLRDYEREVRELYKREGGVTLDASLASQARILMNWLGEKWSKKFIQESRVLSDRMVEQTDLASKATLASSLKELSGGITIATPKLTAQLKEKLTAALAENVALIKSIPVEFHQKIEGVIFRSVQQGGEGAHDIYKAAMREITETGISVHKRAKLIAELETSKVNAMFQTERLKAGGVTHFRWRHSGGGAEPRQDHVDMDGEIYEIDSPPIIDRRTGQRGMPGTIWNCRCFAEPVITLDNE